MNGKKMKRMEQLLQGLYSLSPIAGITDEQLLKDPFFNKSGCPVCGDELGGDRYTFTAQKGKIAKQAQRVNLSCCVDCYEYLFI